MPIWSRRSPDRNGPDPVPSPGGDNDAASAGQQADAASAGQQEVDTGVPGAQRENIPLDRGGTPPYEDLAAPLHGQGAHPCGDHGGVVPDRWDEVLSPPGPEHGGREEQEAPARVTRAAPEVPGPPVIGEAPSFPAMLGVIPSTSGAMSGSAVPDTVLDGAEVAGLTIRGASLRGEDHRSQGVVRQDSMGMWRVNDGTMEAVLVCVTDGVSSQPHSHRGAVAVCQLLRDLARHQVSRFFRAEPRRGLEILWEYMAEQLSAQLSDLAVRQKMEPVTLSTTLVAAFIEEDPATPAERRFVILNVGDATAFVLRGGEFTECLADPHEGPVAESRTWTLPTGIGPVGTAAGVIGPRDMLMVCSDGMSNPMRNGDVQGQLAQWWGGDRVPDLAEFGWQLSYRVKSYGDDRTAVCVWGR
jgi:serine/threonine protein phosphatase PrpC